MPELVPKPGLVISYEYLWRHEAAVGQVYGRKARPCAILAAVASKAQETPTVVVMPITHTPPSDPTSAVELPPQVKRHLGMDDQRSWVIVDDLNSFTWPGFDLTFVPGQPGRMAYGFLPPALFRTIVTKFNEIRAQRSVVFTNRDDE